MTDGVVGSDVVRDHLSAALVVIGNEILSGKVTDTNTPFLARELRSLGVSLERALKLAPDSAKALYARRKTQGERPFAEVKQAMGFRRFMLRGVVKVRGEWDLVAAAFNLRRLQVMQLALR